MPELLTRMAIGPFASRHASNAAATCASSVTSASARKTARLPSCAERRAAYDADACAGLAAAAVAIAEPMPRAPPVTTACLPAISNRFRAHCYPLFLRARDQALELLFSGKVLHRPLRVGVPELGCGVQRPARIGEVRPPERDQVGPAGGEDGVDLIGLGNVADRHRRDADLVANLIGVRRLEHPAVYGLRIGRGLAGRNVDQIGAGGLKRARDLDGIVAGDSAFDPIGRGNTHRHRPIARPHGAHRAENFQRIAQTVFQRPAVLVGAVVEQRRDERRQQVSVRAVQLDHIEAGLDAHLVRRGRTHRESRPSRRASARAAA